MRWTPLSWASALDRKLARDLWGMKTQALAIALVIAGGVSVHLLSAGMLLALQETRAAYYDRYRFSDLWAPVVRAPESLIAELRALEGVAAVETRVRAPVVFDIAGMAEPASGEVMSWPEEGCPAVNQVYVVAGRMPQATRRNEAAVLRTFAEAHNLRVGDDLAVTLHGRREILHIVGIVLSPEHVFTVGPGQFVPDNRLFGVIWMERKALSRAVEQDGAFNEVVLRLARGANETAVIDELDRVLAPYGAPGAYGRSEHISDAFISSEIDQLNTMGRFLPPIFLTVAAFLVNIVISRLIATQRPGIGLLKAFGYRDRDVVLHYIKLVSVIAMFGIVLGCLLGAWLGRQMAALYTQYYSFPFLIFRADAHTYFFVIGFVVFAVLGGAALAVRRASRLSPAEAMIAPPPPDYSKAIGLRITKWRLLDQQTRMVLRQLVRWPWRAATTVAGVAAAGALLIGTLFFIDSMERMMDAHFNILNRHDVGVSFVEPRSRSGLYSLERLPGVLAAEPYRSVAARLRHENREERVAIVGAPLDAELSRMVDENYAAVAPPPGGLVLSRDLADKLDVSLGMPLQVEFTEGRRNRVTLPVAAISNTFIGSAARMEIEDLNRLMSEGANISGAYLKIDSSATDLLYAAVKRTAAISGVSLQSEAEQNFEELMDRNIGVSIWIYTGFAGLIALGVVYNSVRISFSERERELASLRVLGFSQRHVSYILLGEIALLTLFALPIGAAAGVALAYFLSEAMASDLFRLPFVIHARTFGYTAFVIVLITAFSAFTVRGRVKRLDLVSALKMGD
jgi:putative ABC transport system permease protein